MMVATNPHHTRGRVNKKTANTAANDLMAQVAHEKQVRTEKKKKHWEEKEAD
jgi:hypothetical protein